MGWGFLARGPNLKALWVPALPIEERPRISLFNQESRLNVDFYVSVGESEAEPCKGLRERARTVVKWDKQVRYFIGKLSIIELSSDL